MRLRRTEVVASPQTNSHHPPVSAILLEQNDVHDLEPIAPER
jgi:hypothetical protein